jgi:hypothetical protein
MKRLLVFALVLVFTGAAVFAVDLGNGLTVGGEVKTGLKISTADDGKSDTEDTNASLAYSDAGGRGFRTRLTPTYEGDWGGAKVRLEADWLADESFGMPFAYGWANLLDKKIVLYAGDIDGDLWGLGKLAANAFDPNQDAVEGVRAEFKVVEGLSFGFSLPLASNGAAKTLGDTFGSLKVGGVYSQSLFGVAASVGLNPGVKEVKGKKAAKVESGNMTITSPGTIMDADGKNVISPGAGSTVTSPVTVTGTPGTTDEVLTPAQDPWFRVLLGVAVKPIDILTVALDADIDTRKIDETKSEQTHDKAGYFKIGTAVNYASGPLSAYVKGNVLIQNYNYDDPQKMTDDDGKAHYIDAATKTQLGETYASWAYTDKQDSPAIGFELGADYKATETITAYGKVGSDNVAFLAGNGIWVKPGVKFALGTSTVEISDKIAGLGMNIVEDFSPITN